MFMIKNRDKILSFILDFSSREKLIKIFPPSFNNVICHHVTIKFGEIDIEDFEQHCDVKKSTVVGILSEENLEVLVVKFNGSIMRNDGNFYHITHSLTAGKKKPVDSNKLLRRKEYIKVPEVNITGLVKVGL